jgi:glutamyl/glutaminyl-tRNA synthetase
LIEVYEGTKMSEESEKKLNAFNNLDLIKETFKNEIKEFSIEGIQAAINQTKEITKIKGRDLFMPLRLLTTYQKHGPELAKAIYLFGEKLVMDRLS